MNIYSDWDFSMAHSIDAITFSMFKKKLRHGI